MGEQPSPAGRKSSLADARGPATPLHYGVAVLLGLMLGTAAVGGYRLWSSRAAQHALETAPADPDLAKPSAVECAVARAALAAAHASGEDAHLRASVGAAAMSLRYISQVNNPADTPGYSDAEADNLRSKPAADWRWCAGMGTYVRSLGWSPMDPDEGVAELTLGRPGMSAAGDEAKVYETFVAPQSDGAILTKGGPWLVTLNLGPDKVWRVTGTADLRHGRS